MTITQSFSKLSAIAAGLAVAFALIAGVFATATPARAAALTSAQVSSIISLLQSFGADAQTIANVQASLTGGTPTGGSTGGSTTGGSCPALTRDLQAGSTGADVMALQQYLNSNAATMVAASGAGSPGNETSYFGPATKAAVIKFQTAHSVSPAAGYVGPLTRASIAANCGGSTGGTTPTGPGITVSAGAQPANALAPASAARVPFTTFTLTNNSGVVQTVSGITVQRTGFGVDANFSGVVLVDSTNNIQLGIAKTLNSNHQATIGDNFTINPGQTMTLTVAGNIADSSTAQSGQIVSLQVVAVNSTAAVSGVLPINGASHTINTNLTLGSYSTTTSSYDPGIAQNKSIGDTAVRFSGIRFSATSQEDLKLYSIRWRQAGTASASDLGNVVTNANGVAYPAIVSADGKYYTTTFAGGLTIPKGQSIDVYIQGDIVGSNVSGRTAEFDIDRSTDVYFVGQTYGYGIAASGPNPTAQPWFKGYVTTINPGSASTISRATEVGSQNIAINVSNQPLGAFATDFTGEAVSAQTMTFTIATSSAATGLITDISLYDENGVRVSGPSDATWVSGVMTVTLSDTVTFPTGRHVWKLQGKIPSSASSGATVQVTVNPSTWTNVQGQISGSTVSLGSGFDGLTLSQMTVQGASLTMSLSSQPASQTITSNQSGFTFARVVLDASGSGEDIRVSNVKLRIANATGLTGCQLWDGSTALNIGSNVITSPSTSGDNNFVFNNTVTVTKGMTKSLDLKCNLNGGSGNYQWTFASAGSITATGVTSGNSITVSGGSSAAGTMAVGTPTIAVTVAPSSPGYAIAAAGTAGVTLGTVNFRAESEDMTLRKVGLTFASGDRNAVSQVYLTDGLSTVGTVTFVGSSATSSLMSVTLPAGTDKVLSIKADIADITTGNTSSVEGVLVKLNPDSAEVNSPSQGIVQTGASGAVAGVRLFKSFPTLAAGPAAPSNSPSGNDQVLKKFSVTADSHGSISLNQFKFSIGTSTGVNLTDLQLHAYTDSGYSNAANVPGTSAGLFGAAVANTTNGGTVTFSQNNSGNAALSVGAGQTVYFTLTGDVSYSGSASTWLPTISLQGDSSFAGMSQSSALLAGSNFVWSPNATTTTASTTNDWTNGAGVTGLPSTGL